MQEAPSFFRFLDFTQILKKLSLSHHGPKNYTVIYYQMIYNPPILFPNGRKWTLYFPTKRLEVGPFFGFSFSVYYVCVCVVFFSCTSAYHVCITNNFTTYQPRGYHADIMYLAPNAEHNIKIIIVQLTKTLFVCSFWLPFHPLQKRISWGHSACAVW